MTDNDDGADRRLSRRSFLLGVFTLPFVVVDPEPASAQLGLIGAMLGGFRFRYRGRRHYGGYRHSYRARPRYTRHHRGRAHVAGHHHRGGGGGGGSGGGGGGGGGQFSKGGL